MTRASFAVAAAALLVVSAWFIHLQRRTLVSSGLIATYPQSDGSVQGPGMRDAVTLALIRARAAQAAGPFSINWDGYLVVPATARYRFAADVDDGLEIEIDRQPVLRTLSSGSAQGWVPLNRGLHQIRIRYTDLGGSQKLSLYWAPDNDILTPIAPILLVPDVAAAGDVRLRRTLVGLAPLLPLLCSGWLLAAVTAIAGSWLRRRVELPRAAWMAVAVAGAGFLCGIAWGLPDYAGWAPDEVSPGVVADVVANRFARGWASIYPLLHYGVLALFTAPFHVFAALAAISTDDPYVISAMFLVLRSVSVLMALGVLVIAAALGARISARASVLAVVFSACVLPLTYYAKLANVDVPSLFWFMAAMLCYVRAREDGRRIDYVLFAGLGAAAIATKDQSYGLFVLPAVATVVSAWRRGDPSPATVGWMIVAFASVFITGNNVVFNAAGFVEHVRIITGVGSAPYRMYDSTLQGQVRMFAGAVLELGRTMSWPLFAIAVASAVAAVRARAIAVRALLLTAASYYLTVIAVVGYHYDRFFLAPAIVFAIAAAWGVDRWLAGGGQLRRAVIVLVAGYGLLRVAALDTLIVRDSRYAAEAWLVSHTTPETRVAAAGHYLPRRARQFYTPILLDAGDLRRLDPDLVVVNVGYVTRELTGTRRSEFYDALSAEAAGYRKVFGYRTRPWWSVLNLEARFAAPREDPHSNLSKINPLIEIYARPPRSGSSASSGGR